MAEYPPRAAIEYSDMLATALLTDARFHDRQLEMQRMQLNSQLLSAAYDLEQALRTHTRCTLVNHCGTAGQKSLRSATDNLFSALLDYGVCLRESSALIARLQSAGPADHGEGGARVARAPDDLVRQ